ncbi:acyltransferase [Streptomyces sp. RG38]|uniref:Acyltransferase n=1 Tax=Streptomyces tagetis TaxID=2820809 RepID=A0A940XB92_9ACTN|nr:acyltransferase [Streptomyces sp. RG38]
MRGIAALVVVFDHSSYVFLAEFRRELMPEFSTSRYGIMVFFLVSGYVIPASLERRGCVRTFWIGRLFRVYPLWAAVVGATLVLDRWGLAEVRDYAGHSALGTAVAHLTLLQELLATPGLLLVLWTLSYEMAFYLLTVALFSVGLHERSAATAGTLSALAAVSVAVGWALPASALSAALGTDRVVAVAAVALVAAVGCACARAPVVRVSGAVLGGVLALALVAFNGTVPPWEGLVILALMFLGTAVRRAEQGGRARRAAVAAALLVVVCAVGSAYGYGDSVHVTRRGWILGFLLAVATFGAGLAWRRRHTPRWLAGLGTVSYSLYLVHPVLLAVVVATHGRERPDSLVRTAAFYAVLLPVSVPTHRAIEAPAQSWGRRLAHRVRAP